MILNEFFNLPQVFEKDMAEDQSQHTDMTVAQQVFKDNPNIDHEDDIMNAAFPYVVELVGSRKRANYMFNYDEDFPSDLIGAYRYLQRDQHDVGLEEGEPGDLEHELEKQDYQRRQQRDSDAEKELNKQQGVAEGLHPVIINDLKKLATLNPVSRYSAYANIRGYFKDNPELDKMASNLMQGYFDADILRGKYKTAAAKAKYDELEPMHQAFIKQALGQEQGVAEGIFGSKPSPVLPLVDKIAKLAGGLTPQNVEVGKQIIQANVRNIQRMLSPQIKPGVEIIEAKDDYVPPKEADYGPEYQDMVLRVGEKARAQEKAKQQQPKQPVRESRRALLKQIIQS